MILKPKFYKWNCSYLLHLIFFLIFHKQNFIKKNDTDAKSGKIPTMLPPASINKTAKQYFFFHFILHTLQQGL